MSKYKLLTGILLAFLFLALAGNAQRFNYAEDYERILQRSKNKADSLSYEKLLPKFLRNDPGMTVYEMLALMIGYTGTATYKPYEYIKTERLVTTLNDKGSYMDVVTICDTFLQSHPLSQQAIIEKAYAFHKLNNQDSASFYKEQFSRIMAAMDWSGDGRAPETAMFAIGQKDGENFVDKFYHAEPGKTGMAEDADGNLCQMVEMKFRKDGKERRLVFYFIIQHAVNSQVAGR
jgi:hypothetical protein